MFSGHDENKYLVIIEGTVVKKTKKQLPNYKKAGAAFGGGIILGPVGAIVGLAAYPDEPPKYLTKKKIIKNQSKFKDCTVQLTEDRILVKPKRKATLEIRFLKINSMRIFEKNDGFEIYAYNMIYKFYNNAKSKPATDKLINDIKYELDKLIKKNIDSNIKAETKKDPNNEKNKNKPDDNNFIQFEKIKKLGELRDSGLISNDEFENKKKEILKKI